MFKKNSNFLLVDDDETFCRTFAICAKKNSFNLDVISNPMDLLDISSLSSSYHSYDVVLVDINLGTSLSGFDCIGYLEGIFSSANVYLISSDPQNNLKGCTNKFLSKRMGIKKILKKTSEDIF